MRRTELIYEKKHPVSTTIPIPIKSLEKKSVIVDFSHIGGSSFGSPPNEFMQKLSSRISVYNNCSESLIKESFLLHH
jgi:hypothetical protein